MAVSQDKPSDLDSAPVTALPAYTANNLKTYSGLMAIRNRPTQFFRDTEQDGQNHALKEIIDNSIDEISMIPHGKLIVTLCRDLSRQTYQFIIQDNGRGIPIERDDEGEYGYIRVTTKLNSSGKFDTDTYAVSSGLFGVGLKAAAGTSAVFRLFSRRPDGIGDLLIKEGVFDPKPRILKRRNTHTGVTTVYEPDPSIFSGISAFAEAGYARSVDLLRHYVFFRPYDLQFRVTDQPIPADFWTSSTLDALKVIDHLVDTATVLFDSRNTDTDEWIHRRWSLNRPFAWKAEFRKTLPVTTKFVDWIIKLYYVKFDRNGGTFGLLNNIPIHGLHSDHLSVPYRYIAGEMAHRIQDPAIRKFYLENYKLPLFLAVDIKYSGAQPGGTTKDIFRDPVFREEFKEELTLWGQTPQGQDILNQYYHCIEEDIVTRYNESLGVKVVPKDRSRLSLQLLRGDKYRDCRERDPRNAELFLVEGDSAGGGQGYLPYQATYLLGGKPLNVINKTSARTRAERTALLLKKDIYHDLFKIIGYDPHKPNFNTLNFKNCYLTADGDKRSDLI